MPLDPIPKSLYPLVPDAPGVPPLLRNIATSIDAQTFGFLGLPDALSAIIGAEPVRWAVFDSNGQKIGPYESVFAVSYQNDTRVSDYPVEQGAFASYNKVNSPFDINVSLNCGGSEDDQAALLTALENAKNSLELFTVVTPTYTYRDVNFTGLAYRKLPQSGGYMLQAELIGREIRQKASAAYSLPQIPAAYDNEAQGQVQIISDPTFDASGVV